MKKISLISLLMLLMLSSCGSSNESSKINKPSSTSISSITSEKKSTSTINSSGLPSVGDSSSSVVNSVSNDKVTSSTITSTSTSTSSNKVTSSTITSTSTVTSSSNSTSNSGGNVDVVEDLAIPSLTIDETTGVVTWGAVEGATHYNYIINDSEILTTTSTTITLTDKTNISVQAANDERISSWSDAVTFYDTSDVEVEKTDYVNVYFHNSNLPAVTIKAGETIAKPVDPTKNYHTFDNWYKDPFYTKTFDFNEPIYESTIIYANYIKDELIDNVYFWVKANEKMTSAVQSTTTGWRFIPLHRNENQTNFREFMTTVTVSGASSASPCQFLIMDGFDDNQGRTYWKYGGSDFNISTDGTYNIYFSVETQYMLNGIVVNATYELANNTTQQAQKLANKIELETPVISIDYDNNLATWDSVAGATQYEVIINNQMTQLISNNYININKSAHISVRAIGTDNKVSNWSIPKANVNFIEKEDEPTHYYVYFMGTDLPAQKVEANTNMENHPTPVKEDFTFSGWYLDLALTKQVTFPYLITENTVFYPKWDYKYQNYQTQEYYKIVDSSNNKVGGLTWNYDNFTFLEYEIKNVLLNAGTTYYIKTLDDSKSWGPYSVSQSGTYSIYFSEDYLWNVGTEWESNIYCRLEVLDIYFTNALSWSGTIKAYAFNKATGDYMKAWPGTTMEFVKTNSYGQDIYHIQIDASLYDYIIFTNGSSQTIDISLADAYSGIGYYTKDSQEGSNYKVGSWEYK